MLIKRQFPVQRVFQDNHELEIKFGVSAVKAKQVENDEWNFAVLQGNTPRLIFPKSCVALLAPKRDFGRGVFVTLDTKPQIKVIIQFDNSTTANMLYNLIATP